MSGTVVVDRVQALPPRRQSPARPFPPTKSPPRATHGFDTNNERLSNSSFQSRYSISSRVYTNQGRPDWRYNICLLPESQRLLPMA